MKTLQNILDKNLSGYLGDRATNADELSEIELNDLAHEWADNDERVIYYSKAHALIASVSMTVEDEATQMAHDCGGFEGKSYNEIATIIAYWIVYQENYETLREEIEELVTVLEAYNDELSDQIAELDDESELNAETVENLESEQGATEDLISNLQDK